MGFFQMLANDRGFMFFYALMKMTCGITDIIRIARITFENVNNALVVNQSGLLFLYLELFLDLTTRENWLYISSDFPAKIFQLMSYCVGRFLVFKWQSYSDR